LQQSKRDVVCKNERRGIFIFGSFAEASLDGGNVRSWREVYRKERRVDWKIRRKHGGGTRDEKRREGSESIGFLRYVSDLRSVPLDRCDRSGTSYDEEGMYRNEKK
jgi:hypothetical protein